MVRMASSNWNHIAQVALLTMLMLGCSGGGDGQKPPPPPPLGNDATLSSLSIVGVSLSPSFSSSVTDYTASVPFGVDSVDLTASTSDGSAGFTINGESDTSIGLVEGDNAISIDVTAENGTTTRTYTIIVTRESPPTSSITQEAYIKASNTDAGSANSGFGDHFGFGVALSGDGRTLAASALLEDSGAPGVNGDQTDNNTDHAGAVYVFTYENAVGWTQQAYVKASNPGVGDLFGVEVSLSEDGNTLAVGAREEESSATGVNGDQVDDSAIDAGAVYVFTRDVAGVWTQQAYIKSPNTDEGDVFGHDVALSADGDTLVIGSHLEASSATGVNGDQTDNNANDAGAVYVYTRDSAGVWMLQAYLKASNTDGGDFFGWSVAVSADGGTLAAGAHLEDSATTGVGGDQADNSESEAGAVYVYVNDGAGNWSQQAYIKASNTSSGDHFGKDLALSADGDTLAVSATLEDSAAAGINGVQSDDSATNSGAVYVFTRDDMDVWAQQAYLKASNTGRNDGFGWSVALSHDGNVLAAGGRNEDSTATGVNGDQTDDSASLSGAAYVINRDASGDWAHAAYIKASNPDADDFFGVSVSLSADGSLLAIGAEGESSAAVGVNGDQLDNSSRDAGAVYVFR